MNLAAQGQDAAALSLAKKTIDRALENFGGQHQLTGHCLHHYAVLLGQQGRDLEALPYEKQALAIYRETFGPKRIRTAGIVNSLAAMGGRHGPFAYSEPLLEEVLDVMRTQRGELHPHTAYAHTNLAFAQYAQGKYEEAEDHLRAALRGYDIARVDIATSGFERSLGAFRSPRQVLAATLVARRGDPTEAWQYAEADLARSLLDDVSDTDQGRTAAVARRRALAQLDDRLVPLLVATANLNTDQRAARDEMVRTREKLVAELAERAADQASRRLLTLDKVQAQLAPDAVLVFWIDARPRYYACVVRRDGPPHWQELDGTSFGGNWSDQDRELHQRVYEALATPDAVADAERTRRIDAFVKLRLAPLRKHLQATGTLPAVRRLLVVPTGAMAQVPLEALTREYTISYVPSASVFARLAAEHRPLHAAPLLALGDPVFAPPSARLAPPPETGVLVQLVLPNGNAAKAGLQAGDVLLRYNDTPLKTIADLKIVPGSEAIKVVYWRDGAEKITRLQPGRLILDKRDAPEAVAAWRAQLAMTASLRSTGHQPLKASRFEVEALSRMVGVKDTTLLLGSGASERALDNLGKDALKRFRILHFATHGDVDLVDSYRSALILAQDQLPDGLEASRKGAKVYNGRLTVDTILRSWDLDADLVVLSACQTALGKSAGGDGLLGFAQAFLQKGARSVVLSRWKVEDTATALLMLRFYENALGKRTDLKAPMGRAAALDEARHWLREQSRSDAERYAVRLTSGVLRGTERDDLPLVQGKARLPAGDRPFAHPFYWAAFVLIGDPD